MISKQPTIYVYKHEHECPDRGKIVEFSTYEDPKHPGSSYVEQILRCGHTSIPLKKIETWKYTKVDDKDDS